MSYKASNPHKICLDGAANVDLEKQSSGLLKRFVESFGFMSQNSVLHRHVHRFHFSDLIVIFHHL